MSVRRSARIAARKGKLLGTPSCSAPPASPPPPPPHERQQQSPPLLAGRLWLVAWGVIGSLALRSAVVAITRPTAALAPPCHVAANPSHLVPCATFLDLNRIFAHVALPQASVEDAPLPPHFFADARLAHIPDKHIDRQWRQYYSYRAAETFANTLAYDPVLQGHLARVLECATAHPLGRLWRWVRSVAKPTTNTDTDMGCGEAELQRHLALAREYLLLLLEQWTAGLRDDSTLVRDAVLRSADARKRLEYQVQVMAVREENNSSSQVWGELYIKRAAYAAWLIEESRWTCRDQEYTRAIAAMEATSADIQTAVVFAMEQPQDQSMSPTAAALLIHDSIGSWITNAPRVFRGVIEGASTRERACAEQHMHAKLAYCLPVGFDAWAHEMNSTTFVLINNGTVQYEETTAGSAYPTCEFILDPLGKGCTTHPQRIWWAWHNQDNLSSPSSGGDPPPHLAACAPLRPSTLSQHWSRHLWPPSTREGRAQLMKQKENMGGKAPPPGFALPLDPKAAGGKPWTLPPWKGVIRVRGGWWNS